jgi:hypothetical protein
MEILDDLDITYDTAVLGQQTRHWTKQPVGLDA